MWCVSSRVAVHCFAREPCRIRPVCLLRVPRLLRRSRLAVPLLLATACGGDLSLDELQRFQATEQMGRQADTAKTWQPTANDPVTLTLTVPKRVARGTPVPVRVLLHNGSARPVSIGLGQNEDMELLVARVDRPARQGAVYGPAQLQEQQQRGAATVITDPIRPGRDSTFQVLWPQTDDLGHRVPPGSYRVRAVLNAELLGSRRLWTDWATVVVAP